MSKTRAETQKNDAKVIAGFRTQMKSDRVETTPFKTHTALKTSAAALAILAIYIYGWGDGITTAFQVLLGREFSPRPLTPDLVPPLTEQLIKRAIIIASSIALFLWLRTKPTARVSFPRSIKYFAVAFLIVNLGMVPMLIIGSILEWFGLQANDYPHPAGNDPLATFLYIINGATAGPAEEILMIALVAILMRKLNIGWTPIMIVAIILRIPFHMYYGWAAIAMIFWVIASVLFYKFTNRIWPLVLAHATKNTVGGIVALGYDPYGIAVILVLAALIYGMITTRKHLIQLGSAPAARNDL